MEANRSHASGRHAKAASERARDSSLQGKRVLLAEDDEAARKVVAATLRQMGLDVIEANDGGRMLVALAWHYKAGHSPDELDLVITDVCMPVICGLDVFQALRAALWTTPVIVTTGDDTPEVHAEAAHLGAVVLPKPLELDLLEQTVRDLLARSRQRQSSEHSHHQHD